MYAEFFGFRELPFNITPDPRFLYLNDCYQEALAALAYGIQARKGFISLVGEAGTGKTTMLRRLLDTLDPRTKSVLLLNPTVGFDEILDHVLRELGVPSEGGGKLARLERLNEFLLEHTQAGGNVVLLIDEAQDLGASALEELRLLSNLETAREKIIQIVLAGQPELDAILAHPNLRQLRQRVTLRVRVRPLTTAEVAAYVRTRLQYVGSPSLDLFNPEALERIASFSRGIPRLVNVLCDSALLTGFVSGNRSVTPSMVEEAWADFAHEVQPPEAAAAAPAEPRPTPARRFPEPAATAPPADAPAPTAPEPAPAPVAAPVSFAPPPPPPPPPPVRVEPVAAPPPPQMLQAAPPRRELTLSVPTTIALLVAVAAGVYSLSMERMRAERASQYTPPVAAPAPTTPPPAPPPTSPPVRPIAPPAASADGPLSTIEAAKLIDEFRAAYELRDVDRLVGLFAPDAAENGRRGLDLIAAAYRSTLGGIEDIHYTLRSLAVDTHGLQTDVKAPFVINYRQPGGPRSEIRGEAEWKLERRDGRPRIVELNYRLEPEPDA